MAVAIFPLQNNPELRTLLEERMQRQMFLGNSFANWIGPSFVDAGGRKEEVIFRSPDGPNWTGAPIEPVTAFIEKGRTDMLVPVRNILTGKPVFGGQQLFGTGEAPIYTHRSVLINRTRKAYSPPTGMEWQKTKQYQSNLVNDANRDLTTWRNNWFSRSLMLAFHAGASEDLTAPVASGGRGVAYVSHPNFFVAGSGQVSYGGGRPGTAGYEASVETALNSLSGIPGQDCNVNLIRNLVMEAKRLKIRQVVTKDGFEFYPIWLKDTAWIQLQKDPEFQALAKSMHMISKLSQHPLGNNAQIYISGAVIYTDLKMWCARTNADDANVTAGTVEYGPAPTTAERGAGFKIGDTITSLDTGNKAIGILVGQSALSVGTGERVRFTDQMWDHENVKEVAIEYIESTVRNETYDTLGLVPGLTVGQFYENTSSLVFATWSPFALAY